MQTITVKRESSLKEIEQQLEKVAGKITYKLRLPNSLKDGGSLGVESHLMQLIATWLRSSDNTILHTYAEDIEAKYFDKLCERLYGIISLSLSDKVITASGDDVLRKNSLQSAKERIEAIRNENYRDAFKGGYVGIPSIKAPGYKNEFLSPLYNNEEVVDRRTFRNVIKNIIDTILPNAVTKKLLNDNELTRISEITRELFGNTHKHARRDEHGNIIQKNFRYISYNAFKLTEGKLAEMQSAGGKGIVYFAAQWGNYLKENSLTVLDVSIVDSGPGFARRWMSKDISEISILDERKSIIDCFKKHNTSDIAASSGSGLTRVLRDLRKSKGLFRVRTGNFVIEKSFYFGDESIEITERDLRQRKCFAEGTVFNFLIPLVKVD